MEDAEEAESVSAVIGGGEVISQMDGGRGYDERRKRTEQPDKGMHFAGGSFLETRNKDAPYPSPSTSC